MNAACFSSAHARLVAGVFVVALTAGCAAPQTTRLLQAIPAPLQAHRELAGVPYYPQKAAQCGPASLAMLLSWSGVNVTPETVAPEVFLPGKAGSLQPEMVAAARRHGRFAYVLAPELSDLLAEVATGHPVIVFQNLGLSWLPEWHYAVVIGYDLDRRIVILHSGPDARHVTPLATFERTWARADRWALVVLPPDQLPATASESRSLESALALEQTGQPQAALTAYRSILNRWPGSAPASIGIGNILYSMGRLSEAENAFRQATVTHPDSGIAFNNLAQTLADEGKLGEATIAARQAVALGGELAATYQDTLQSIEQRCEKKWRSK